MTPEAETWSDDPAVGKPAAEASLWGFAEKRLAELNALSERADFLGRRPPESAALDAVNATGSNSGHE